MGGDAVRPGTARQRPFRKSSAGRHGGHCGARGNCLRFGWESVRGDGARTGHWARAPKDSPVPTGSESSAGQKSRGDQRLRGCEGTGVVRMRDGSLHSWIKDRCRKRASELGFRSSVGTRFWGPGRKPVGPKREVLVRTAGGRAGLSLRPGCRRRITLPDLGTGPGGRLLAPTYRGLARQTDTGWDIVNAKDGLTSNDISAVIQDREGSIWIGLLGVRPGALAGLQRVAKLGRSGRPEPRIHLVDRHGTRSGRLWVGSQFGLNYAETAGGKLVWRSRSAERRVHSDAGRRRPDGTLWIGTDPGGLHGARTRKPARCVRSGEAQGSEKHQVRHVAVDHEGSVWVATTRAVPGRARKSEPV